MIKRFIFLLLFPIIFFGNNPDIDSILQLKKNILIEIGLNNKIVFDSLSRINPDLFVKDVFEKDVTFFNRIKENYSIYEVISNNRNNPLLDKLSRLEKMTFITTNIDIELVSERYNADTEVWNITIFYNEFQKESYDLDVKINKNIARDLLNSESMELMGVVHFDHTGMPSLREITLTDSILNFSYTHIFKKEFNLNLSSVSGLSVYNEPSDFSEINRYHDAFIHTLPLYRISYIPPDKDFSPWQITPIDTNCFSLLLINSDVNISIQNSLISPGDWIGFFYNDNGNMLCGGSGIWTGEEMIITIFGDNPDTRDIKEGFSEKEFLTCRIWDHETNQIMKNVKMELSPNVKKFKCGSYMQISSMRAMPSQSLFQIISNPTEYSFLYWFNLFDEALVTADMIVHHNADWGSWRMKQLSASALSPNLDFVVLAFHDEKIGLSLLQKDGKSRSLNIDRKAINEFSLEKMDNSIIWFVELSKDGQYIAIGQGQEVTILKQKDFFVVQTYSLEEYLKDEQYFIMHFSKYGKSYKRKYSTLQFDGAYNYHDILPKLENDINLNIDNIAIGSDSHVIATSTYDNSNSHIRIYNNITLQYSEFVLKSKKVLDLELSPNSNFLYITYFNLDSRSMINTEIKSLLVLDYEEIY